MALDDASQRYLASQGRGRLATVGPDGHPQNKPVGFHYNAELGTIDISGIDMEASAKYRNIAARPDVAFVVDDAVSDGAAGVRFVEIRGPAEQVTVEPPAASLSRHIIRIHPRRLVSWNIDPDHPGLQTRDLAASSDEHEPARPALGSDDAATGEAIGAVAHLVEELQAGWDEHDAEVSNQHFADNVAWGSPFGATVNGYDQLHAIHVRLKQQGRGGPSSRYEIVRVLAPAPDVAVAHVRRVALDPAGRPLEPTPDTTGPFSEMALYVLVKRNGTWWLAAGQNTPVRPAPD
jgi:pyridoxamine 5'-phosphate oxidase family protein